ncbi:hypothetical protein BFW01_g6134 [Lasiodiplodia theobromae]|uniref:uncharacterized protein n=1 Tax=Lasiodiplodia theobromae TaxID=45133 RepID=UPI0015C33DFC|nr:uncharacterized protein LTHEOB_11902 [Lasiodiplodia theobromae]KAF4536770.1 hypothetical protein LTHEOB_11902 [Lasiodiplodia theobromae]KAF9635239.1 hypothetical protein BFW01_g6134 [Lasiodiplodia theobromae]
MREPVLFMRLPAKLRNMVYRHLVEIIDCPNMAELCRGRSLWDLNCAADSRTSLIKSWQWSIGIGPKDFVYFPLVVLKMDPRIQQEFASGLLSHLAIHMRDAQAALLEDSFRLDLTPLPLFLRNLRILELDIDLCDQLCSGHISACTTFDDAGLDTLNTSLQHLKATLSTCDNLEDIRIRLHATEAIPPTTVKLATSGQRLRYPSPELWLGALLNYDYPEQ